jgi:hypothetical protein
MKYPLTLGLPPDVEVIVSDSRLSGSANPSKMTPPTNCSPPIVR